MIVPILVTGTILLWLYAEREGGSLGARHRAQYEVTVLPEKYNATPTGSGGKRAECSGNPACDARAALMDLGYTDVTFRGSDDPDLAQFRAGKAVTFLFDASGQLRADRDMPTWLLFVERDPQTGQPTGTKIGGTQIGRRRR